MSAAWSLTYLQSSMAERELFDLIAKLFVRDFDGKLYDFERGRDPYLPPTFVKLNKAVAEWFQTAKRANLVFDALLGELYGSGVILYPRKNGLITLADSVIHINDTEMSGRTYRPNLLTEQYDPQFYSLFKYMDFLQHLTEALSVEAVHLMYERNPAGHITGIHLYKAGQLVDEYYSMDVEGVPDFENVIDLPKHPEIMQKILGGRFAFLLEQPKRWSLDGEEYFDVYFEAEHLGAARQFPEYDVFNMRESDLYVPFWDENMLPLGAVYCLNGELPEYFVKAHL